VFESYVRISGDRGTPLNQSKFKVIQGSVCAPQGFQAGAVFCGIKTLGTGKGSDKGTKPDLAIIVSDIPATVAATFTTNRVCAAPVKWSARIGAKNSARAVVVNSGNANACTGRQGMLDAERMARVVAAVCDRRTLVGRAALLPTAWDLDNRRARSDAPYRVVLSVRSAEPA
jgi:N-acetylglutamate synthase/N-acetylornithine aminotransferase